MGRLLKDELLNDRNCFAARQVETWGEQKFDPDTSLSRLEGTKANIFLLRLSVWVLLIYQSSALSVAPTPYLTCGGGELVLMEYVEQR